MNEQQQPTLQQLQQENGAIKIRCFDAETAASNLQNNLQHRDKVLTQLADMFGVMTNGADDTRVFKADELLARAKELVEFEENNKYTTPIVDAEIIEQ